MEVAINLAAELEFIRGLERSWLAPDAKVRGVAEKLTDDERIDSLLGVVEGLQQEVKSLQTAIETLVDPVQHVLMSTSVLTCPSSQSVKPCVPAPTQNVAHNKVCWQCECNRHLRCDCHAGKLGGA